MLPSNSSDADQAWRKAINKPVPDSRFKRRHVDLIRFVCIVALPAIFMAAAGAVAPNPDGVLIVALALVIGAARQLPK
jgi:hypothetical protein